MCRRTAYPIPWKRSTGAPGNSSRAIFAFDSPRPLLGSFTERNGHVNPKGDAGPSATAAALIPIQKSAAWWALPQDERRAVFEDRSHHIAASLGYLPRIARRLHHGRDLGEPFDFVTWFEFAPADAAAFDELCAALRATEEWSFVEREVEVRLIRDN